MKYTVKQIAEGEDEIILKYREMTPEVEHMIRLLGGEQPRLMGYKDKAWRMLEPKEILYLESVDGRTFAYTIKEVLRVDHGLGRLEALLGGINFFRCSKSMIINIDKVSGLRSLSSNRIDATMCNGEHIIISRTYASDFRKRLKRGGEYEAE